MVRTDTPKMVIIVLVIISFLLKISDLLNDCKNKLMEYNFDCVIDDWCFLSYLVGNDFIPTVQFLNMRDGAYEYLLQNSKICVQNTIMTDYLTNGAIVNFIQLAKYFKHLTKYEKTMLKLRSNCFIDNTCGLSETELKKI